MKGPLHKVVLTVLLGTLECEKERRTSTLRERDLQAWALRFRESCSSFRVTVANLVKIRARVP